MERKLDAVKIGKRLKKLRGDRTQEQIANILGLSKMTISQYEQGERVPADKIKIAIAELYNQDIGELFFK